MVKTKARDDQFLLALLAVVFAAAAVIFLRAGGPGSLNPLNQEPDVPRVLGAGTPDELMQNLGQTEESERPGEFVQLRNEAKGL
jgi:hypothetical protein